MPTSKLPPSPTPKNFADAVVEHQAQKVVDELAGKDGRLSRSEAKKAAELRSSGDENMGAAVDNIERYFKGSHKDRPAAKTVVEHIRKDAERAAKKAAGPDGRLSGADAADGLPAHLYDNYVALRAGAAPTSKPGPTPDDAGDPAPVGTPDGGGTATTASARSIVATLRSMDGALSLYHESGDHGVNVTFSATHAGGTLGEVLARVTQDPDVPWTHGETQVSVTSMTGAAAIEYFLSDARSALESENENGPEIIDELEQQVAAAFAGLQDLRLARGDDLGGVYLLGKAADGWVAAVSQPYSDG